MQLDDREAKIEVCVWRWKMKTETTWQSRLAVEEVASTEIRACEEQKFGR